MIQTEAHVLARILHDKLSLGESVPTTWLILDPLHLSAEECWEKTGTRFKKQQHQAHCRLHVVKPLKCPPKKKKDFLLI